MVPASPIKIQATILLWIKDSISQIHGFNNTFWGVFLGFANGFPNRKTVTSHPCLIGIFITKPASNASLDTNHFSRFDRPYLAKVFALRVWLVVIKKNRDFLERLDVFDVGLQVVDTGANARRNTDRHNRAPVL